VRDAKGPRIEGRGELLLFSLAALVPLFGLVLYALSR